MAYSPYSITRHTLLPLIYTISHQSSLTYLLRDPVTSSLLLLPTSVDRSVLKPHIRNIEKQFKCKLTHSFTNSKNDAARGPLEDQVLISAQSQGDLRPFLLGELSICYISAPGYRPDYNLVAVTHDSPTSTKFSVLFPGKMVSVCSIDIQSEAKGSQYCQTIHRLKFFPNQTLIFPQTMSKLQDLQFAQALENNDFLTERINTKKKQTGDHDSLMPTSIMSQKMMNPFLSPKKYASLLETNDMGQCFDLLRSMRRKWKK